ncbi:amidohydrolase family protein [Micromonospora azadirachtae]|uniref:Amidohydrolase family protein n=1 Tax=Micromonospora azadirachtae TaxID=1970735 RepID=A0ABW2ZZZ7_9ACTN
MATFAVRAARMFDGTRLYGPSTVTVEDGRIARVDTTGAPPAQGVPVIDVGEDAFLLPGLIDAHVHLAFDASADPVAALVAADDAELLAKMRTAARRAVRVGITTVRDLGDRNYLSLALRTELADHPENGPDVLAAGPPITTPGGHCHFLGGQTESTTAALLAAVRERHERGCAVVKIMASGGNMTAGSAPPYDPQFSLAELRLVVDEAHRLGLPVAAHAHATSVIRDALDAGVDTIEHMSFMTEDGVDADPALLARIVASDTFVSPTVGYFDTGRPVAHPPAIASRLAGIEAAGRRLFELGAKVVPSTDAGIGTFKPHDVLPLAVAQLVAKGVPMLDVLAAVTSVAARACHVADHKGRISVGADADLLVTGDLLDDIGRISDVRAVIHAGVQVPTN